MQYLWIIILSLSIAILVSCNKKPIVLKPSLESGNYIGTMTYHTQYIDTGGTHRYDSSYPYSVKMSLLSNNSIEFVHGGTIKKFKILSSNYYSESGGNRYLYYIIRGLDSLEYSNGASNQGGQGWSYSFKGKK